MESRSPGLQVPANSRVSGTCGGVIQSIAAGHFSSLSQETSVINKADTTKKDNHNLVVLSILKYCIALMFLCFSNQLFTDYPSRRSSLTLSIRPRFYLKKPSLRLLCFFNNLSFHTVCLCTVFEIAINLFFTHFDHFQLIETNLSLFPHIRYNDMKVA